MTFIYRMCDGLARALASLGLTDDDGNAAYGEVVSAITPDGFVHVTATLTRPNDTTAYAQYDLVADSTSAAAATEMANGVRAAGGVFRAEKVRLRCSDPLAIGQQFRLHVWRTLPVLSVNDNSVFNTSGAGVLGVSDIVGHVGYFDVTLDVAGTAGAAGRGVPSEGAAMFIAPSSGTSFYVTIERRSSGTYTPVALSTFAMIFSGEWA